MMVTRLKWNIIEEQLVKKIAGSDVRDIRVMQCIGSAKNLSDSCLWSKNEWLHMIGTRGVVVI